MQSKQVYVKFSEYDSEHAIYFGTDEASDIKEMIIKCIQKATGDLNGPAVLPIDVSISELKSNDLESKKGVQEKL